MKLDPTIRAAFWMIGAATSFSAMAIAGRELSDAHNPFQILFWRSVIGFAIIAVALALADRGFAQARTAEPGLHAIRHTGHFAGQALWFAAIGAGVPLGQVFALEFTTPIWVALAAPLFLGERFSSARAVALVCGFTGVMIVLQPWSDASDLSLGHAAAAAAALGFAVTVIATKRLTRTETTLCILFWMTLSQAGLSLISDIAYSGALPPLPRGWDALWMAVVAVCGLGAHFCIASAFRAADALTAQPMDFFRLPLIAVAGAVLYGDPLSAAVLIGGALIVSGNAYALRAEARARAAAKLATQA